MKPFTPFSAVVKLGKKGQLTLPKKLRDADNYEENDEFLIERLPSGGITIAKRVLDSPEDRILAAIAKLPRFDVDKAMEEVRAERRKDWE